MWDPRPPSKHASPLPLPHLSNSRLAHVTTATPAKRITFYKSGDSQFGGIRMAVHKRSFKCFDALLDDLSQKVPLPFGVRTVTTPRGTHAIKHLEQLQDGGCYLCSDRRHAKPVNMELASKRPGIWSHHSQRPHRPETLSTTPPGHLSYRQRRILLVKNTEPGMRRSIVLGRRSTRSLRAFLDEVSEVMQFHVRKLYTAEGRRIDSVQSLITCPGVLVCVGREAFSPMLVNFIRKSSDEKLPGLGSRSPGLGPRTPGNGARSPANQGPRSPPHGAQSRASEYSEGHESKKNVNFGLETKKSIIHPRSDSSNRSARFSLSSEKSYSNGVSAYSQARPGIMNEDIEKRVVVNKDGSLSVEMRVRFRLHNEETLQWSTQIKKSPSLSNESCPLSQAQPHYLQQGQSESCSDPDSTTFEPECVDYSSQPLPHVSAVNHCPCCYQRQEQQYDLWENPAHSHKKPPVPPPHTSSHTMMRHTHSSSSSSSCNSRRVVRCRARLSNCGGGSGSEQSQLLQEDMCVTEQVERRVEVEKDGDTHVKVHRVSRCCSRSEVLAVDSTLRPLSRKSVEDELLVEDDGVRPLSAVSSSSHVLQSLREDEDDDLPPSASQCCHSIEPSPSPAHLNDKPKRNISSSSIHSTEHNKHEDGEERGSRAVSTASSCHCGAATPHSTAEVEEMELGTRSKMSRASCRSSKVNIPTSDEAADDEDEELRRVVSGLSGHTGLSADSLQSRTSSACHNCGGCKHGVNSVSSSRASQRSHHSHRASPKPATPLSSQEIANDGSDDDGSDVSAGSTQSNRTNLTNHGRFSAISNVLEGRSSTAMSTTSSPEATGKEEERAPSATSASSHRSNRSHKSGSNGSTGVAAEKEEERSPTALSAQSNLSAKSSKSHKSNCSGTAEAREEAEGENAAERPLSSLSAKSGTSSKTSASVKLSNKVASPTDNTAVEEDDTNERTPSALSVKSNASDKPGMAERPDSVLSAKSAKSTKSNVSAKSRTSHRSTCSHCPRAVSPGDTAADEPVIEATEQEEAMETEERAASAMSAKSHLSARSNKSHKSTKASERSLSPRSETGGDCEKRAASQLSGRSVKSDMSVKSSKSCKPKNNDDEIQESPSSMVAEEKENEMVEEETQERPESVMSAKLENEERAASARSSKSHKSNCNENTQASLDTGDGEKAEDRAASALSGKSASSAKSHHTNCEASSRVASPAKDTAETEDRIPSAMSGKSHISAKSSKSQKSNRTAASPNPNDADVPSIETNEEEKQNQERVASAMSVKSKSSVRSSTSHKSNSNNNLKSVSPNPNIVTIKTPEVVDEEGNETTERAPSAASAKSGKSASSHKSKHNRATDITVAEKVVEDNAPKSKSSEQSNGQTLSPRTTRSPRTHSPKAPTTSPRSPQAPVQQLLPGPDTRGASALSVRSTTSAKSCKSKCRCGAASAKKEKEVEDKEMENKDNNEELKNEEASERAASILSSSTKRSRRESGGTEQPLSRNSSGSVSLGLPEDQETADSDSGRSSASFHINTESKSRVKTATPNAPSRTGQSATKEDVEETGSTRSQKSNKNGSKSTLSHNAPAVDIPTIETPGQSGEEACSKGETCSESLLFHSLSAADLLKEIMAAARPHSRQSKASKTSDKPRSEKSARSQRSRNQVDQEELELTPACLPNASPNEVVSDWLRSIPTNSSMLEFGDEPHQEEEEQEKAAEEKPGEEGAKEEESPEEEKVENKEEVSPVYGRRLSTSARGFLDCLAQLQLIEPAVNPSCDQQKDRNQRYEDIMAILQSLWLTDPKDIEVKEAGEVGREQVTPPRSSSGVGMSSGSGGSGKENGNDARDETKQNITINEEDVLHEDKEAEKVAEEEEEENAEAGNKEVEEKEETDTAQEPEQSEEQSSVPPSLDSPKATENPSSSDANDSSKSPTDNERETMEDSSSGTPPTVLRAPLSKKQSQDPDPVWILQLLKKLEKQFMNHYINAMAEFKVRWDLDDSLILDTMISELRDEVSRRIQSSIEREIRKIQSRAGRGGRSPRPPHGGNLSRESTMTEKRRRILKVMKNQSVKTADTLSDEELTGEFSDQRSEDEYCPCDACVRKKMAARPLKANPLAPEAPMMIEFDLLKILQLKKSPLPPAVPPPAEEEVDSIVVDEEERNLEVLHEEEEEDETKEDIKATVVLEETIPEEDEEIEEKEDGGEAGEEKEAEEEKEVGDEEQEEEETGGEEAGEEEETGGEEAGEEETTDNGEDEEEAQCQCQCGKNEEESEGDTTENGEGEEEAEAEECEVCDFKPEEEEETTSKESGAEASGETEDDSATKDTTNEESTPVEGNDSASAEAEDEDEGDDGSGEGEASEEQEREEEERPSTQGHGVTEGEEADAEDSSTDSKRQSDTSPDESGREGAAATGDEEEKEGEGDGGDEEVVEDAVEEFKPEEEGEDEEVNKNKREAGALLHQFTRTSVESQPGSLEDIGTESPQNPVNSIEVPKMADGGSTGGGTGQKRSRSPARVKRRKPKESDVELDDI
ncbi:retinitis pigmentosa 1-like 1 protein [Morone saxatilis]|uniref:retinitis pigmentosa 1-like 1 protein n=1 Tax=Morone saxatilis TaxID=34816 RepID=UPI0015E1D7F0|nr:retinitis pigmentosa 1-like 1 protein [Morone saxatilis]